MKSVEGSWASLSNEWYNDIRGRGEHFYTAFDHAEDAVNAVMGQGDIGHLSLPVQMSDIEDLNEKRRRIVSFCNGIHYEISEKIDNPFSREMSSQAEEAYNLNPSDIKVNTGTFLFVFPVSTSLQDLISSTITNDALKKDFESKCKDLDSDELSETLKETIKEAIYWQAEFERATECKRIAEEVFTEDVRNQWKSMTQSEREKIARDYADKIAKEMKEGKSWWDNLWRINQSVVPNFSFTSSSGYGGTYSNGDIEINLNFVSDPTGNFSVDKMIDTITHETRHAYQNDAINNPDKYGIPQNVIDGQAQTYVQPSVDYKKYYNHDKERDARGFAAIACP